MRCAVVCAVIVRASALLAESTSARFWRHVDGALVGPGLDRVRDFARAHFDHLSGDDRGRRRGLAPGQECDVPFPGLCARPWHPTEGEQFKWAASLEEHWRAPRDELGEFLGRGGGAEAAWAAPRTALCPDTADFAKLVLLEDGSRPTRTVTREGHDHFSRTISRLLRSGCPLGPRPVSINRQPAGSGLEPHTDNANFLLTGHLGLVIPPPDAGRCEFVMTGAGAAASARRWCEGRVLVSDTSFVHATRNDADSDRFVLHFTIWHPGLSTAERAGIVRFHEALRAFEAG